MQIWSPLILNYSNALELRTKLIEIENIYEDETFIWLSPKYKKNTTFEDDYFCHLMVPSKTVNKITVYHVNEDSQISPPLGNIQKLEERLYKKWQKEVPEVKKHYKPIVKRFPSADQKNFYYKKIEIEPEVSFINNYERVKNKGENLFNEDFGLGELIESFSKGDKRETFKINWPTYFDPFFENGGGILSYCEFYWMRYYIKLYNEKRDETLKLIRSKVNTYTTDAITTLKNAWIYPRANILKNLFSELEFKFNISLKEDIDVLENSNEVDILGKEKISIKRIYSWLGYFWYELYKDCLNYNPIKFCKNCGTLITGGRRDKIYCTKKENPNCWKERSALRTKKNYYKHQ